MHYVTAVHMNSGGADHDHIAQVRWLNVESRVEGIADTAGMVEFIDDGNDVFVEDATGDVPVGVVRPDGRPPHLRTFADGDWTNNLLSLPRY